MSFHGLYGLSGHFVLCVLARSALVFVLHSKWKKQRKEKSHAHCHVTHRIRIFEKIFELSKVSKSVAFAVPEVVNISKYKEICHDNFLQKNGRLGSYSNLNFQGGAKRKIFNCFSSTFLAEVT